MDDLVAWLWAQLDAEKFLFKTMWFDAADFHATHDGVHIAVWNRATALAEVEAKRRILEMHPHKRFSTAPEDWPDHWRDELRPAFPGTDEPYVGCQACDWDPHMEEHQPNWWCQTVRLLALPHAGRPGYRDEWRPA